MQLKRIKVSNFRSFKEINIELNRFNVLIGANASGKSNFINVFKFFNDINAHGLENAISLQGGADYLTNINIGVSNNLSIDFYVDFREEPIDIGVEFDKNGRAHITVSAYALMYSFSIEFNNEARIAEEKMIFECKIEELQAIDVLKKQIIEDEEGLEKEIEVKDIKYKTVRESEGKLILMRNKDTITYEVDPKNIIDPENTFPVSMLRLEFIDLKDYSKELILRDLVFSSYSFKKIKQFFTDISIYDIQPKLLQLYTMVTGKTELEPDGENLALVLRNILNDEKKRQKLFNSIKDFLPFVEGIRVKFSEKYLSADLKEIYSEAFLPAFLMSEGTIIIVTLIIILYFEKKPLVIIEELEKHIHPYLTAKLVDMMKDVSERMNKQIIVTTHNPEVVRYGGIENILLVNRDDKGFSKISRPSEKKEVQAFLKNEMGIEELYVQNLLEW